MKRSVFKIKFGNFQVDDESYRRYQHYDQYAFIYSFKDVIHYIPTGHTLDDCEDFLNEYEQLLCNKRKEIFFPYSIDIGFWISLENEHIKYKTIDHLHSEEGLVIKDEFEKEMFHFIWTVFVIVYKKYKNDDILDIAPEENLKNLKKYIKKNNINYEMEEFKNE